MELMAQVQVDQGTWILEYTGPPRVPVRLLNPTTEPLTLHAGKQIAVLKEVDKVLEAVNHIDIDAVIQNQAEVMNFGVLLKNRLLTSPTSRRNHSTNSYSYVFAFSPKELGRTGKVKHSIDTSDARPIRQPVR